MKFVFKINSGYDQFTPAKLPDRMVGDLLDLGWTRYLDSVSRGDEVWVYFKGPHRFEPGVYARGRVGSIDRERSRVFIRVFEQSTEAPLEIRHDLSEQITQLVEVRYLQVFPVPEALPFAPDCTIASTADSCARRLCEDCSVWPTLKQIDEGELRAPERMTANLITFVPAYWVVAPRSVAYGRETPAVSKTTELFMRFKTGQRNLAFPLALGMHACLRRRQLPEIDALIPIPLSPDKAKRQELNRTLVLARELELLTGIPVKPLLSLAEPISKVASRLYAGYFEQQYAELLQVDPEVASLRTALIVDDVSTNGSTVTCAYRALRAANPGIRVGVTTAGQMTVKSAVADVRSVTVA